MNFRARILSFFLVLVPVFLVTQDGVHIVQRNETFFSIARIYGTTAEALMNHNGITDPLRLQAGQSLRIPNSGIGNSNNVQEYISYRVVRGDTFFSLTRRFSVTEREIREVNNLSASYVLREGDTLRIPVAASIQAPNNSLSPQETLQARPTEAGSLNTSIRWPIRARDINYLTGRLSGVMITGERNEPVISLTHGTVISVGPYRGFGRVAIVQVEGGYLYVYGGCEILSVREGDRISPGTEIGRLGLDIVTNLPQLFFMVYRSNSPVDPALAPRA